MKKKSIALALAGMLTFSSFFTGAVVEAEAAESYVTVNMLTDNDTATPAKDSVLPDVNQYEYQKQELAAFCHFGPNTFNEIEWGEHYGSSTPDQIFMLEENFDAETMVSTLKDAGFEKLIVTAKHHDGFCIWNSKWTTYDVESTSYADYNYDNMGGDVLAEISAACTEYDMDMGLYLSPWDIHEPSYGTVDGDAYNYNDFYNNQLVEILGNDKYGNAGHFKEVWMDGAKGSGAYAQEYDFQRWFATIQKYEGKKAGYPADCMLFGAEAYTTVRWIGNEHGYAAEETWSKSNVNYDNNTIDSRSQDGYTKGYENGNKWTVPESDARITSGWFWGTTKKTPKTVEALAEMYFRSVGHNSPLLLNIPPNNQGAVDQAILDRVKEFGENVTDTFQTNIMKNAVVSASEVRGNAVAYSPINVLDGDDDTYWTVNDGTTTGTLLVNLGATKTFDVVSIEEAIQFGQRIKEFKIEYSNEGGEWKTFDEGTTIGAKRLSRKAPVKADQLRITVKTSTAVPMITEVGAYKASEGFELAGAAPDGMEVIDISDTAKFTFASGWTQETGDQYLNGTNAWANPNTNFTVSFKGTKIYLIGTLDPNHGTADIYIDDEKVGSIDTNRTSRSVGQIIYESGTLSNEEHTLKLVTTNKAIGIEGAYVINNGGLGMIGIEESKYTMNEQSQLEVKLVRVGGSTGAATVEFTPNPGSAIQDDYNTERNYTITFADGETEKTAIVETRRNTNKTGDRYFTVELATANNDLILGFNSVARITIKDSEGITTDKLQTLVNECEAFTADTYTTATWTVLETALKDAKTKLAAGNMSDAVLKSVYETLEAAKNALVARETYTADDRFQFPDNDETRTLEMEFLEQHNNTEGDGDWPLQVTANGWASNGKFLNCLNSNDTAVLYYNAPRTGTYSAVVTYRSGDSNNSLKWEEASGKITAGEKTAGASDGAGATHTEEFEFVVTSIGEGTLTFKGGASKAPQLDKIVITAKELDLFTYNVTKAVGENGVLTGPEKVTEGGDAEFTVTPNEGYLVADVKVNGTSVGAVASYTVENVKADIKIEATFKEKPFKYSTEAPFVFPAEVNGTAVLEAEYAAELNNSGGDAETWKLGIADATWASEGKFVNCLNRGDNIKIPYTAETAGTYSVTVQYRSGSGTNYLAWYSEPEGNIVAGTASAGNSDSSVTKTATFNMVIDQAGAGVLVFAPTTADSPQLDKFDITLTQVKEVEPEQPDVVDKTDLKEKIDEAKAIDKADYTEESYTVLAEALIEAEAVYAKEDATRQEVTEALTALMSALNGLTEKPAEVTAFEFPATVGASKTLEAEDETYVKRTNTGENEQWPMTVVTENNVTYIDAMNNGDYVEIVYTAEKVGTYTVKLYYASGSAANALSWSEESGKITAGSEVAGNTNPSQWLTADLAMEVTTAGSGILKLTPPEGKNAPRLDKFEITFTEDKTPAPQPADYTDVDEAIERAEALDETLYKNFATVEAAIAAVNRNKTSEEQAEVDAMAKTIEAAIDGLVFKDADYSKVTAALAKVPADLSKYTDTTVKAVNDAKAAVTEGLDITKQSEVDAMAKAIEDAIAALKEKEVEKPSSGGESTDKEPAPEQKPASGSSSSKDKDKEEDKKPVEVAPAPQPTTPSKSTTQIPKPSKTTTTPAEPTVIVATSEKAEVSVETLEKIVKEEAELTVEFEGVKVTFDTDAIGAIAEQAKGSTIELRVVPVEHHELHEEQQAVLEKYDVAVRVSAQIFSDGEYIGDFKGAKATIAIPFTPEEGKEVKDYNVYYVADNGDMTLVPSTYANEHMIIETDHFSDYVIVYEGDAEAENAEAAVEEDAVTEEVTVEETQEEKSGFPILPIIIGAVAVIAIAAFIVTKKKNNEK